MNCWCDCKSVRDRLKSCHTMKLCELGGLISMYLTQLSFDLPTSMKTCPILVESVAHSGGGGGGGSNTPKIAYK